MGTCPIPIDLAILSHPAPNQTGSICRRCEQMQDDLNRVLHAARSAHAQWTLTARIHPVAQQRAYTKTCDRQTPTRGNSSSPHSPHTPRKTHTSTAVATPSPTCSAAPQMHRRAHSPSDQEASHPNLRNLSVEIVRRSSANQPRRLYRARSRRCCRRVVRRRCRQGRDRDSIEMSRR